MVILKDIGEHELLTIISQYCDYGIACDRNKNGDDAAILDIDSGKQLVVTTDVLVENVHFSDRTTPPQSIGYRAVTANLSDIAAMGAIPLGITVGLSLREDVTVNWLKAVYQGMEQSLKPYHINIVGGDITRSKINTIAITALGQVKPENIIYRHTAKQGDLILITGYHGLSKAGLELLLYPHKYSHISSKIKDKVMFAHQYPKPRLDVIKRLYREFPEMMIAGMDSSDGLADAIIQICEQSRVGAKINLSQVKVAPELVQVTNNHKKAIDWTFYGGEDFELVLCTSAKIAEYLYKSGGEDCQIIGEITTAKNIEIIDPENNHLKLLLNRSKIFQHF